MTTPADEDFDIGADYNPEDKYGRFFRDYHIDIELIEQLAFAGTGGTIDLTNYYTKTQVDTLLATKENTVDLANYYTKTQIDSLLAGKADATALNNFILTTAKGAAGGVATLDNNTLVPVLQIPTLTPAKVGLANVDNTSDLNKPISTATQSALDLKADVTLVNSKTDHTSKILTFASTIAIDASLGDYYRITLTGATAILANPTNLTDGWHATVEVIQDAVGNRALTLDTKYAFGTDVTALNLSTAASKHDFIGLRYNSTTDKVYVLAVGHGY